MKVIDVIESVEAGNIQTFLQLRIAKIKKYRKYLEHIVSSKGPEFIQEELETYLLSDKLVIMLIEEEAKTNPKVKSTYHSYQQEINSLKKLLETGLSYE